MGEINVLLRNRREASWRWRPTSAHGRGCSTKIIFIAISGAALWSPQMSGRQQWLCRGFIADRDQPCFLGTAFLELGHQYSGPLSRPGFPGRTPADHVTVWAPGFQKPMGQRKPSKSAAPEDRVKLLASLKGHLRVPLPMENPTHWPWPLSN